MPKTLRTANHAALISMLRDGRKLAGLTQQEVADRLGVPQSFVAKYEGGERRLDVLEFIAVARAIGAEPVAVQSAVMRMMYYEANAACRSAARAGVYVVADLHARVLALIWLGHCTADS